MLLKAGLRVGAVEDGLGKRLPSCAQHSLRVATMTELRIRGIHARTRRWIAWWRGSTRVADGYEAVALEDLLEATQGYGSLLITQVSPGVVSAAVSLKGVAWSSGSGR